MAITNLRVVCKIITCVPAFTEMAIIDLSRDSKSCCWSGHSIAGYAKDAIVDACHRTSDGQEHKIIWRAEPERDSIFHVRVTACREQGSHCCNERLAWVANNLHPVADKSPCALTGSNL